jgi:periplasmic protein CpxP/Spy
LPRDKHRLTGAALAKAPSANFSLTGELETHQHALGRAPQPLTSNRRVAMNLTPEQRNQVVAEAGKFATNLHLTSDQKEKLQTAFTDARAKVGDYLKDHPGITKSDIAKQVAGHRDQIRQRVVNFLSPEQLKMWDAEMAKAKEFLGQNMSS